MRIILSLRAVGEGHISSIVFREGVVMPGRKFELTPQPSCMTAAPHIHPVANRNDGAVTVHRHADSSLSGTVIFPVTEAQRNGLGRLAPDPLQRQLRSA